MKIFKKKGIIIFLLLIAVASILFFYVNKYGRQYFVKNETKIGWVTDIHADNLKKAGSDSGILHPEKYVEYLPKVFDAMHAEGIDVVIATGDSINSNGNKHAEKVLQIAIAANTDMIWVKGNHDTKKSMSILGFPEEKYYYFRDFKNTRIIVLNNVEYQTGEHDQLGEISSAQFEWIKQVLKTEKQIIIAMHIPMFSDDKLLKRYEGLEKLLYESGNVKMVLSGHFHYVYQKEYNGIRYYTESALTRDGEEGAYAVIDLENSQIDYKFAK